MITITLTEWEIMVLRAALVRHIEQSGNQKHIETALTILKKSRQHDKPAAALKKLAGKR